MLLNYSLIRNRLVNGDDVYSARVKPAGSIPEDTIIDEMLGSGTMATRTDIIGVDSLHSQTILRWLKRGYCVKTGLVNFSISIRGNFDGKKAIFDPAQHQLVVTVSPGPLLESLDFVIESATRIDSPSHAPNPADLTDHESGTKNQKLTRGGTAQLEGRRLRFDQADPNQGIFFMNGQGGEIRVEQIMDHKPSTIWFKVPAGPTPGTYRLEVRTGNGSEDNIISGRLPVPLTIE
jgi:hypothetical protein